MKEYIEREALIDALMMYTWRDEEDAEIDDADEKRKYIEEWLPTIPAADVVDVKLLDDGTLIVTTDKYPNATRVFVEDGKTSGSLFYAEEV